MTGTSATRSRTRRSLLSTRMKKKRMMLMNTIKRVKLVPQRLWNRLDLRTFSTVSFLPCSRQLIHLCSAP